MNQWVENLYINYRNVDTDFNKADFFIHSHDYFEIYIFHQGDCKYAMNDETFQLIENDIIVMNGSTLHGPLPKEGTPYERTVIEFSSDWILPILEQMNLSNILTPFTEHSNTLLRNINDRDRQELNELAHKLHLKRFNQTNQTESKAEKKLMEGEETTLLLQILFLIYKLSNDHTDKTVLTKEGNNDHVRKIIAWIDHNYSQRFTLEEIATELHLSKCYMARIFKEATGLTVMEYVMQRRLMRAKYLLEFHPSKSILEIALETGFESASHFSRRFRKYLQVTPSDYRNVGIKYDAVTEKTS